MSDIILKNFKRYLKNQKENSRFKFKLQDLEEYIIKKLGGYSLYMKNGGYRSLYEAFMQLKDKGAVSEIKSSPYNGFNPPLRLAWRIEKEGCRKRWDLAFMMKISDLLDMSGYMKNYKWHTPEEKKYIESIYKFLKSADKREWVSCEERCLELFGERIIHLLRKIYGKM